MIFSGKSTGLITVSLALMATLAGCGSKSSKDSGTATATATELAGDSQLQSSVVNASHGDTVSAAADQSSSGAALALSGNDDSSSSSGHDDHDHDAVTKVCAVSGNSAIVSISSAIDETKTSTSKSGTVTNTRTRTGSSTMTRTWSRSDGTAVTCNTAGTGANVDFKNPSGLKLDVSIDRSRSENNSFVGPKLTRTSSKSFSVKGKNAITWSSNDAASDTADTYIRNKSIAITDVTRSMTMTNKNGLTLSSSMIMNTAADKPVVVSVERNKTSHEIVSKTFVSGEVVVKKDADATITTDYSNFKLDSECKPVSGSATIVITDSKGAVLKSLILGVDSSGDAELKDKDSGSGIDGFALDGCDAEDSKG